MDSVSWSLYCRARRIRTCVGIGVGFGLVWLACIIWFPLLLLSSESVKQHSAMNFNAIIPTAMHFVFRRQKSANQHFCFHCFECFSISTDRNCIIFKSGKNKKREEFMTQHKAHSTVIYQMKPGAEWKRRRERPDWKYAQTYRVIIVKPKIKHLSEHDSQINSTFAFKFYCKRVHACVCGCAVYLCYSFTVVPLRVEMKKSFPISFFIVPYFYVWKF